MCKMLLLHLQMLGNNGKTIVDRILSRSICAITVALMGILWSGCAGKTEHGFVRISTAKLNEALIGFDNAPNQDTIVGVFKWCFGNPSIALGDYDWDSEHAAATLNGIPLNLKKVTTATRKYVKWLAEHPGDRNFETLAALQGMICLGKALEKHEESYPRIIGLFLEEKALLVLVQWAQSRGYTDLHKALLRDQVDLGKRVEKHRIEAIRSNEPKWYW